MIWSVALAVTIAGTPSLKIAAQKLSSVQVPEEEVTFFSEHLADELSARGLDVVTPVRMAELLGLERQRQLMGCQEGASSCLAELAGALGVEVIVMGAVARLDGVYQLDVKALSAGDGKVMALFHTQVARQTEVVAALARAAEEIARKLLPSAAPTAAVAVIAPAPKSAPKWPWIPVGAGAVVVVAGGILLGISAAEYSTLSGGQTLISDPYAFAAAGSSKQVAGAVCLGVGVAALATGLSFLVFGKSEPVAIAPLRDGVAIGVGGSW